MERRIYVSDLDCYRLAGKEEHSGSDRYFDLCLLPTEVLQDEFSEFVWNRGRILSLKSIRTELWLFRVVSRFLREEYPRMESLREKEPEELIRALKKWMMKNGYPLVKRCFRRESGKTVSGRSNIIRYLDLAISFFSPQEEVE